MALSRQQETNILRYYFAEQWRVGTIARQLGLHHSTVERVIAHAGIPKPQRTAAPSMIDPFLPFIVETLAQFPSLSATRIYQMAVARGYPGGSSHFRQHVAQLRPKKMPEAFLRLNTLPGEQGQADWGLCRARHNPHYADSRTMPSHYGVSKLGMKLEPPYSA